MDDPMSIFWMAFEDLKDGVPILTQQRLHTNTVYIYIHVCLHYLPVILARLQFSSFQEQPNPANIEERTSSGGQ